MGMEANGPAKKGFIQLVNWHKLQRYKKVGPPWIMLYTSLVTDEGPDSRWQARARWRALGAKGQSLLVNLFLYAAVSSLDGRVWGDPEFLASVLPVEGPVDLAPLFAGRFIRWSDDPPLECEQPAGKKADAKKAESESEGERERKKRETLESPAESGSGSSSRALADSGSGRQSRAEEKPKAQPEGQSEPKRQTRSEHSDSETQRPDQSPGSPGQRPVIVNASPPPVSAGPPYPLDSDGMSGKGPGVPWAGQPPVPMPGDGFLLRQCLRPSLMAFSDPAKDAWVTRIFKLLGFQFPQDSPLGRQEAGSFSSCYDRLLATALPDQHKVAVLARMVLWAEKSGRKTRNRKRGAVFCDVFNGRLAKHIEDVGLALPPWLREYLVHHRRRKRYDD